MDDTTRIPEALAVPRRGFPWTWVLPLLAVVAAGFLAWSSYLERGTEVRVHFREGHGVETGDSLRYRGIHVGEVVSAGVSEDFQGVDVRIRLRGEALGLARDGSRFWIVRPHVSLEGIGGLDTVFRSTYMEVLPGPVDAGFQDEFVGLEEPPLFDDIEPGGLEILLTSPRRYGLSEGAPIYFRQFQVGSILSTRLSSDATSVEVHGVIRAEYVQLIRENTVFWDVSGLDVDLAFQGVSVAFESLRTLFTGGVVLATPSDPGKAARNGHVFELHEEPEDEWLLWNPSIPVGTSLLPAGVTQPAPQRATLSWDEPRSMTLGLASKKIERVGNVLQLAEGLLGPKDMLTVQESANEESSMLEVAGERFDIDAEPLWVRHGLALFPVQLENALTWPEDRVRHPALPEDCLVSCGSAMAPRALAVGSLEATAKGWSVSENLSFGEPRWHGACVLARSDGALVGLLLVEKGRARVALVPGDEPEEGTGALDGGGKPSDVEDAEGSSGEDSLESDSNSDPGGDAQGSGDSGSEDSGSGDSGSGD